MKKLVTAACALVAGMAMAQVQSANTVGFLSQELDLDNDEYLFSVAAPFTNLGTVDGNYVCTDTIFDTIPSTGDKVYVFDSEEWNLAMYQYNGTGNGWTFYAADGTRSTLTDGSIVVLKAGEGAYFEPQDSREWTVTLNY
jgi:hypothetical protein